MTRSDQDKPQQAVPLKDPVLAAFLAWLLPGLGHLYQGRPGKAILFFVCLMGTFVYGCYLGGRADLGWARVVYMAWREDETRLSYLCQVAIGLPALPALIEANRARHGRPPLFGGMMYPPEPPKQIREAPAERAARLRARRFTLHELSLELGRYFELGTVYTTVAGLLNILAIYDAWGGPVMPETAKKEDEDQPEQSPGQSPEATPT